jgi:hypothetical protein
MKLGVDRLEFLDPGEKNLLSRIQGRTYANMFGFVERFIVAKILEITHHHWLGDQVALEALVRFSDEELKHRELFRRIEKMMGPGMPEGYKFPWDPNEVAAAAGRGTSNAPSSRRNARTFRRSKSITATNVPISPATTSGISTRATGPASA